MPKVRDKLALDLKSSSGASFADETMADEHSVALSILWDATYPEQARVSLHSHSLDSLEARGPLNYPFKENMTFGGFVEIRIA
ncbi:hypothetical protein [Burkholderia sp. BE17]|uniref:hypothetical protein n=1 Tax=Burkholderia sp. BE17 TaxID=2656644 RepID=UPI00187B1363|nr:hypothetical protein [Burkholderia sp. BE17]